MVLNLKELESLIVESLRDPRVLVLTAVGVWAARDFQRWCRVDGGFPLNPLVWALSHIVKHTLSTQWATARYTRKLTAHPDTRRSAALGEVPERAGPRPETIPWGLPHRHVPQMVSAAYQARTTALLRASAAQHGLLLAPSVREFHHGVALYAQRVDAEPAPRFACDLLHTHPGDGSVHVTLHPRDAAAVIQQGWGEPFALANLPYGAGRLDPGLVLLWAPRNEEEMLVVEKILRAGVEFVVEKAKQEAEKA